MSSFPLSGTVSKCLLVVAPAYAQDHDLLHYIKYKLFDEGFIVVREEYRLVNPELASKLATGLDAPPVAGAAPPAGEATVSSTATSHLIGTAYLYVLAHRDCHVQLTAFTTRLALEDENVTSLIQQHASSSSTAAPLWVNRTPAGSKRAVSLLFPQMLGEDIPTSVESREYVQACLKTALLPALTDLAKEKPAEPLRWLAERLLATNKQAPPMVSVNPE